MGKKQNQAKTIKKYKSAYMFFTQESTSKYKEMYPQLLFRDIFKLIGEEWRNLKDDSKKKYYDLEKKAKEEFEKEKEKSSYKYIKKETKIKKPIKNRTPFMIYLHENKNKIDKNDCILSLKKIGEKWKNISNKIKYIYIKKAEEDKERYKNELIEFLKNKNKIENIKNKKIKRLNKMATNNNNNKKE